MNPSDDHQSLFDWTDSLNSDPDPRPEGRSCAGLVLIAHGYDTKISGEPRWTGYMQQSIIQRLRSDGRAGCLRIRRNKDDNWTAGLEWLKPYPARSSDCEVFLRVDWTAAANHLIHPVSTKILADVLMTTLEKHLHELPDLSHHPIHLIGHSRGASLVCQIAALLGRQGLIVDQVTTLDPHPLTTDDPQPLLRPAIEDVPITKHPCIRFMDNYWQDISYPRGQAVSGAINFKWQHLPNGYHGTVHSAFADHMNVILAYQASISSQLPIDNAEARLDAETLDLWRKKNNLADLPLGYRFSQALQPELRPIIHDSTIEPGSRPD